MAAVDPLRRIHGDVGSLHQRPYGILIPRAEQADLIVDPEASDQARE